MQTSPEPARTAKHGGTDVGAATRQRFIDAAVGYLTGEHYTALSEERRRPDTSRNAGSLEPGQRPRTERGGTPQREIGDRRSPDTLGIRLVAQLAGATHAAPLYYFPDRTCLVAAVAAEGFRLLCDELQQRRRQGRAGELPRVVQDALHYVQWAGENPALFSTMYDPSLAADLELLQWAQLDGVEPQERFGDRHSGGERAIARRVEAFEELLAAKEATLTFFADGVAAAIDQRDLRNDRSVQRVTYALTSMADGLAWQRITEPQASAALLNRHARDCLLLLLQGIASNTGDLPHSRESET